MRVRTFLAGWMLAAALAIGGAIAAGAGEAVDRPSEGSRNCVGCDAPRLAFLFEDQSPTETDIEELLKTAARPPGVPPSAHLYLKWTKPIVPSIEVDSEELVAHILEVIRMVDDVPSVVVRRPTGGGVNLRIGSADFDRLSLDKDALSILTWFYRSPQNVRGWLARNSKIDTNCVFDIASDKEGIVKSFIIIDDELVSLRARKRCLSRGIVFSIGLLGRFDKKYKSILYPKYPNLLPGALDISLLKHLYGDDVKHGSPID